MSQETTTDQPDRLETLEARLNHLETFLLRETRETAVEPWQHLVERRHLWRKQLYVKGRNLTARQLVGAMQANQFDAQNAARNYHLPVEAIREAISYVEQNKELLETEAEIERLMLRRGGIARGPQPVS